MTATTGREESEQERLVLNWIGYYNARDLDGMLACAAPDITYHPLRLVGLTGSFNGHDGLRRWSAQRDLDPNGHTVDVTDISCVSEENLLAVGTVELAGRPSVTSFCAVYHLANSLIIAARHYFSDPSLLTSASRADSPLAPPSGRGSGGQCGPRRAL